jgi:hypothetical protein
MRQWGKVIPAVPVACAMLAVAGCSGLHDIVVGGSELSRVLKGVPDIHIPASDIETVAKGVHVDPATWSDTAQNIGETRTWEDITGKFEAIDLGMSEATSEVALKTACDMLVKEELGVKNPDAWTTLEANIRELPGPPFFETLRAANDAYTVLSYDHKHAAGDKEKEAAVSATCYIADKEFNLAVNKRF